MLNVLLLFVSVAALIVLFAGHCMHSVLWLCVSLTICSVGFLLSLSGKGILEVSPSFQQMDRERVEEKGSGSSVCTCLCRIRMLVEIVDHRRTQEDSTVL